jgi:hypothetical protein
MGSRPVRGVTTHSNKLRTESRRAAERAIEIARLDKQSTWDDLGLRETCDAKRIRSPREKRLIKSA